jgi:hypothetical protein
MRRRWLALGSMVVLVFVIILLRGTTSNDSPGHSSTSDAGNGTSALRLYAEALGHSTGSVEGTYNLPATPSLMFVFTPTTGFSAAESQALSSWLTAGNIVVYAAEEGDPQLDAQFGLRRSTDAVDGAAHAAAPVYGGVDTLSGASSARVFRTSGSQVPLLRNPSGDVRGIRLAVGSGQLIALTDPLVLCNGFLRLADNGRLAADLIALTPTGGAVLFDEFHHGEMAGGTSSETAWILTPWGGALLLAVFIVFTGVAVRNRAFGPRIPLRRKADRSSAEYASAVGGLLHRSGARRVTLETLLSATRRTVAERVGIGGNVPTDQLLQTMGQRSPAAAAELASLEAALPSAVTSEAALLDLARRLHDLAYPLSTVDAHKETA